MSGRLADQIGIVTGAGRGLGAAYAKAMAAEGAHVVLSDVLECAEIVSEIEKSGGKATEISADVTDAKAVEALAETALSIGGRIDFLVNNAALFGDLQHVRFEEIEEEAWDRVMRVNVRGIWQVSRAVIPAMREQKYGKIVNIASTTAIKGTPMMLHYVASKGAVIAMTRAMAREVGKDNICVNAVAPGLTMSDAVIENGYWSDDWIERNAASRVIKRRSDANDLTGTIIFLASREADFITGQTMAVDGGAVSH